MKLGTVAIVLSLIFGGGLTYKMLEQQSEYQTQIAQLQSQLEQAQSAMKQELNQVKEETIEKRRQQRTKLKWFLVSNEKVLKAYNWQWPT